jgi:photosystem II stability/assembly factor-like uncharacterized protein
MKPLRLLFCALTLSLLAFAGRAADEEPAWQPVLTDVLKSEKTGFGGLCGVVVDHNTGCVWVNLSDRGLYCSSTGAKEFKRVSDKQPKGRTETPGCLMLDPTGKSKKMVAALVYGSPISVSDDHGKTWSFLGKDSGHVDWCAVDWSDPDMKFVLALKHEKGGQLLLSRDGGKTFSEVGKGYGPGWVFDDKTAVVAQTKSKDRPRPNLMRTIDGGKTWKAAGEYNPVGSQSAQALPRWHDGVLYWLVDGAIISTSDKGETWKKVCALKDGRYGPVFGKDNKHLFVLTGSGIVESTDGGETWSKPIALPKGMKGAGGLSWIEYDPKGKLLYVMKMGSDLYKLAR